MVKETKNQHLLHSFYKGEIDYDYVRENLGILTFVEAKELAEYFQNLGILFEANQNKDVLAAVIFISLRPRLFKGIVLPKNYKDYTTNFSNLLVDLIEAKDYLGYLKLLAESDVYLSVHFGSRRQKSSYIQEFQSRLQGGTGVPKLVLENGSKGDYVYKCPECGSSVRLNRHPRGRVMCQKDKVAMVRV